MQNGPVTLSPVKEKLVLLDQTVQSRPSQTHDPTIKKIIKESLSLIDTLEQTDLIQNKKIRTWRDSFSKKLPFIAAGLETVRIITDAINYSQAVHEVAECTKEFASCMEIQKVIAICEKDLNLETATLILSVIATIGIISTGVVFNQQQKKQQDQDLLLLKNQFSLIEKNMIELRNLEESNNQQNQPVSPRKTHLTSPRKSRRKVKKTRSRPKQWEELTANAASAENSSITKELVQQIQTIQAFYFPSPVTSPRRESSPLRRDSSQPPILELEIV